RLTMMIRTPTARIDRSRCSCTVTSQKTLRPLKRFQRCAPKDSKVIQGSMSNQSQHDDFLEGFADALGLSDPEQINACYQAWLEESEMSDVERIDFEGGGYQAGLEAGHYWKTR